MTTFLRGASATHTGIAACCALFAQGYLDTLFTVRQGPSAAVVLWVALAHNARHVPPKADAGLPISLELFKQMATQRQSVFAPFTRESKFPRTQHTAAANKQLASWLFCRATKAAPSVSALPWKPAGRDEWDVGSHGF